MGRLKEIFHEVMQHFFIQIIHKFFQKKNLQHINFYYTHHNMNKSIHLHRQN